MKLKGRKPVLPEKHYAELVEMRRIAKDVRTLAQTLPTPKELAERWGISVTAARRYVHDDYLPKHIDYLEPRT
jgi:hypothetical protein